MTLCQVLPRTSDKGINRVIVWFGTQQDVPSGPPAGHQPDRCDPVPGTLGHDVECHTVTAADALVDARRELDDLLDEIDSVLEANAEEFVRSYVQKGGE